MRLLMSERPRPELRNFVRAYAQRVMDAGDLSSVQFVPAELEPVLNFELGIMPGALSGHFAMVASSTFRCCATSAGGVCVSQLDREIS